MSRRLLVCLGVAAALAAANVHWAQPLLPDIRASLGASGAGAGLIVGIGLGAYALGLFVLVPLGDRLDARRLLALGMLISAAGLCGAGLAPTIELLWLAALVFGVAATANQVIIALVARNAPAVARGRLIGVTMTMLLTGIVAGRVLGGVLAEAVGWRGVYGLAAGASALVAVALWRVVPPGRLSSSDTGARIRVWSALRLLRDSSELRLRTAYGALGYGTVAGFWVLMPFVLSSAPHGLGAGAIGVFGLAGIAGVLAARPAGRWADGDDEPRATLFVVMLMAGAATAALVGRAELALLFVAAIALDGAFQALQVLNLTVAHHMRSDAPSSLTAAYMGPVFTAGGAAASVVLLILASGGFSAAAGFVAALPTAAVALRLTYGRLRPLPVR